MKAILKIGYQEFLLPDIATASKAMTLLEKSLEVRDRIYSGQIQIMGQITMEMKTVPNNTTFIATNPDTGEPDESHVVIELPKLRRPAARKLLNG